MRKIVCACVLALLATIGTAADTFAQTAYVRAGATGTGSGTDWTNAYGTLPDPLVRGTTYYVADGSYAAYTFNDAASGTTAITVVKATAADHGTGTGWLATYGDGASTFASLRIVSTGYVDVKGIVVTAGIDIEPPSGGLPSATHHITLRGITAQSLGVVGQDILVQGGSFGGFNACDVNNPEDIIQVWQSPDSGGTYHAATRVTFDGVTVHDVTDNGNLCAGLSTSGRHVDCMQILAGHFITIKNSRFYNCATSDIIARPFRDTLNDIVVENNFFQEVMSPGASINFLSDNDLISGTNIFRYNSMSGTLLVGTATLAAGASIQVYGNIHQGTWNCLSYVTYSYNIYTSGSTLCGAHSLLGTPKFVGPVPAPSYLGPAPDFHLAADDTLARRAGNAAAYPATDIDGNPRAVGGAPSIGADEFGSSGTSTPPAPATNVRVIR